MPLLILVISRYGVNASRLEIKKASRKSNPLGKLPYFVQSRRLLASSSAGPMDLALRQLFQLRGHLIYSLSQLIGSALSGLNL